MAKRLPASSVGKIRAQRAHHHSLASCCLHLLQTGRQSPGRPLLPVLLPPRQHTQATACCPRCLFQDHQTRNDHQAVACSTFHVTEGGSGLPSAHVTHQTAPSGRTLARTCSVTALTRCSLEVPKGPVSPLFPKHLSGRWPRQLWREPGHPREGTPTAPAGSLGSQRAL